MISLWSDFAVASFSREQEGSKPEERESGKVRGGMMIQRFWSSSHGPIFPSRRKRNWEQDAVKRWDSARLRPAVSRSYPPSSRLFLGACSVFVFSSSPCRPQSPSALGQRGPLLSLSFSLSGTRRRSYSSSPYPAPPHPIPARLSAAATDLGIHGAGDAASGC